MNVPIAAFLAAWAILTLNLLTPGPNVLNTITTAMGSGRSAGVASAVAVFFGIGMWCLGMSLGMAAVFAAVPGAQVALTVIASGLLMYFASRFARAAVAGRAKRGLSGVEGLGWRRSFVRSLTINATNPKALTTWIAILGLFPTVDAHGPDIAVLAAGSATAGFAVHICYVMIFSTPAAARFYLRAAPVINGAVAVFFTGFAIKLISPIATSLL